MSGTITLERTPHRTLLGMPDPVQNVESGLKNLANHGVTIHENFISDDLADRLMERMEEQAYMERKLGLGWISGSEGLSADHKITNDGALQMCRKGETQDPIYQIMYSLVNKGQVFRDLILNENAVAYAQSMFGDALGQFGDRPWTLWGMNGIITRRGAAEQVLHTDTSSIPQDMLTRPAMVNCFICVSDFDLEMGPTTFIPGSHLGPRPRYDGDEKAPRAFGVAKKGSALIWDGSTWHGQSEHKSDRTRYAIAMSYCLYALRAGECFPASIQDDVLETLSDEQKRVLGFQTTMVGAMNGFGPRNPTDRHHGIGSSPFFTPELHRD